MTNKFTSADIPGWRFVIWGIVAALAVAGLGVWLSEPALFIAAGVVGCVMAGTGFFLRWAQRTGWLARHLSTLFLILIIAQVARLVWNFFAHRD